jgi:hypothetical protein
MKKRSLAFLVVIAVIGAAVAAYAIVRNPFAPTGTWQLSSQISGTGTQETTEFTINTQWRILWNITKQTANFFIVDVYAKNGSGNYSLIVDADASDTGATQGLLQVDYTGSFVIRVVAASDTEWSLRIIEFVKTT